MSELLAYSLFQDVLFPKEVEQNQDQAAGAELRLERVIRLTLESGLPISQLPIVVFDFETTGLDSRDDEIIELGAIKLVGFEEAGEFHSMIKPRIPLPDIVTKISGITEEMLIGKPAVEEVLPDFLEFIQGSILVAHNANFDISFLQAACRQISYQIN